MQSTRSNEEPGSGGGTRAAAGASIPGRVARGAAGGTPGDPRSATANTPSAVRALAVDRVGGKNHMAELRGEPWSRPETSIRVWQAAVQDTGRCRGVKCRNPP